MATNIATRCTEEEHAKVKAKADELGMTISEYVRFVSLHAIVEVKVKEDKQDGENREILKGKRSV